MKRLVLLVLTLAGCGSQRPPLDHPTLAGGIELHTPAGWSARDYSADARTVLQWTAPSEEDARGARVLVTRVELSAQVTDEDLSRWLVEAQRKLPHSRFGPPISFVTSAGFPGVRIEGEFVPPDRHVAYRRLHAVIVDGTSQIHVIYTSKQLDRESFDAIVDSFSRGGQ